MDFHLPFGGKLRADNRWIVKARLVPWTEIERRYAQAFSASRGAPGISARLALGSLMIKETRGVSDRVAVEQIRENPYLQYFLGFSGFRDEPPFDPSMFVYFRIRLPEAVLIEVNALMEEEAANGEKPQEHGGRDDEGLKAPSCQSGKTHHRCQLRSIRYPLPDRSVALE